MPHPCVPWPGSSPLPIECCSLTIALAQELYRTQSIYHIVIVFTVDYPQYLFHKYSFSNLGVLIKLTRYGNLMEMI